MSPYACALAARRPTSVGAALLLFVLLFGVLGLGCAAEPAGPLWADPGVVRFDPVRAEIEVEIHNVSGTARPIDGFEFGGEDWGSLRFVDDSLPRTIPRNDSVVVRLATSPATFRSGPGAYRSGHAILRFRSDKHEFELPVEFVGTAAQRSGAPPAWLATLILALLGGAALLVHERSAGSDPRSSSSARLGVAGALAALLFVAALIPFGAGYCSGRLGTRVGPAELEQCRAGFGGFELTLLPATPGVWWWLIALSIAAALMAVVRVRAAPDSPDSPDSDSSAGALVAVSLVRVLGFALILAALLIGLAPASLAASDLVLAQLRATETFALPAWAIVAQPLGCAAAFALAASVPLGPKSEPALAILTRFERLLWSALLTTSFLGGWSIPGLSQRAVPLLSHAGTLTVELLAFALKLALVDLALAQLAKRMHKTADASALLRAHTRWTLPLVFLNLVGVLLWRVL